MHQHAWLFLQCKMPRLDVSQKLKGVVWTGVSDLMKKSVPTIFTTGTDRSPWTRLDPQACFTWAKQCLKRLKQVISLNKQNQVLSFPFKPSSPVFLSYSLACHYWCSPSTPMDIHIGLVQPSSQDAHTVSKDNMSLEKACWLK